MSAIFSDTLTKSLIHAYIYIYFLSCGELELSNCDIVWMDSVRYLRNNAWRKIFPQKQGKSSPNDSEGLGGQNLLNPLEITVFIPLKGCWWNSCKPDTIPKEKVLKICKPVSSGVSQGKVPSWTQGPSPARSHKYLDCLFDICHRHVNSSLQNVCHRNHF